MRNALIQSKTVWKQLLCTVIFLSIVNLPAAVAQPDCEWVDGYGENGSPNEPVSCTGSVLENFNQDDGGFTSDDFDWDAAEGHWVAKIDRPNSTESYTITSGVYTLNQDGYVEYGFIFKGPNSPSFIGITIIDAENCKVLSDGCRTGGFRYSQQRGYYIVCLRITSPSTSEEFYEGRNIQFVTTFYVQNTGYRGGRFVVYDNFSVSGSATAVSNPSSSTCSANSTSLSTAKSATLENDNVELYPNPVSDKTTLSFEKLAENATLYLRRADGYLLRTYSLQKGAASTTLDLSAEKPGMYIITLEDESGRRVVRKLFKYD